MSRQPPTLHRMVALCGFEQTSEFRLPYKNTQPPHATDQQRWSSVPSVSLT
jgi:hypothetical protein